MTAVDGSPDTTIPDEWVEAFVAAGGSPVGVRAALAAVVPLIRAEALAPIHAAVEELDTRPGLYLLTGAEVAAAVVQRLRAALGPAAVAAHNATIAAQAVEDVANASTYLTPDVRQWLHNKAKALRDRADTLTTHTGDADD